MPDLFDDRLATRVIAMMQELSSPSSESAVQATVETARLVPGAEEAGVSVVDRDGGIETQAATSEAVRIADRAQQAAGQGPWLDAIGHGQEVYASHLPSDRRWAAWSEQLPADIGLGSLLALPLISGSRTFGALTLYARRPDAFTASARLAARIFAIHAASVIVAAQAEEQWRSALETRTVTSQAVGMVMERFALGPDAAFAVLRRLSMDTNTRLYDVAEDMVSTGRLPGDQDDLPDPRNEGAEPLVEG
ncbi:GAF and ANTAR domain-containing protein [Luteipulveratus sp. YIM 133132]|uniref:GAF and ANTAR domain-containing protein n=1 Tax=Luteipulveratus flavus TaxID=3031728 RepID=UPI0023AF407F|nr:GAF and ANTAR domain-containing protein [Luteipulveratus sp. YIM 133132]MDE9365663.1 GAF and ANTAR domain-containing protein [Luteipulveratus sp. YIM 133132]